MNITLALKTVTLAQEWLDANNLAVEEASKCLNKKGNFNPPLEKPWLEWERLRKVADEKWYEYREALTTPQ